MAPAYHIGTADASLDADLGDWYERLDPDVRHLLHVDHRALDGGPHATAEDVERLNADLLALAAREVRA